MIDNRIRHLIVTEKKSHIGYISLKDILRKVPDKYDKQ